MSREPSFSPALKIARAVKEGVQMGFEHYAELGGIHHIPAFNQQEHTFYGVIDVEKKGFDLNFGIGRAVTGGTGREMGRQNDRRHPVQVRSPVETQGATDAPRR